MKTVFLLLAEYETGIIPLDKVADRWFGLTVRKAAERAAAGALPVPAFSHGLAKIPMADPCYRSGALA